jgi:hypothetical protein
MRRYRAAVMVIAVVMVGCSSDGGAKRAAVPLPPPVPEAWRNTAITPIGQPVAAGDTLVVYGTENRDLYLYGLSAADGTVRWRHSASPSRTLSGTYLDPSVIDQRVVYFRPDPSGTLMARLVVAAPDSGNDLLVSEPALFVSHPGHCADGKDVCVSVTDAGGNHVSRRFSVDAGRSVPDPAPAPPQSRFVGEELLDLGQRQPEMLAGFHQGTTRWRAPLSRYFSAGYSTDNGWDFQLYKTDQLHVGSVLHLPDQDDSAAVVIDLAKAQTVGIEATTGVAAWRADGASFSCNSKIELERKVAEGRWEQWPVRCRVRGILRYDRATGTITYDGLDVVLEGFEVPTGRTLWSVALGAAEAFMVEGRRPPVASDSEVLVQAASGPLIVDLGTGRTRSPAAGDAFWCETEAGFDYREPRITGESTGRWRGGTLLSACTADGSPTGTVPGYAGRSIGATVGERTALSTAKGVVAYDHRNHP